MVTDKLGGMSETIPFVHLHCHSDYSLLDGCARIDKMLAKAASLGMPALALTDHGNLFGSIEFYKAAKKHNVKPILGCEIYLVVDHAMTDRPKRTRLPEEEEGEMQGNGALANKIFHMGLLAKTNRGWQNLSKLVSLAHLHGFHYRPRVDFQTLAQHAEGLIGFTGCMQGVVPQCLLRGERDKARQWTARFLEVFGRDNYYVELQDHGLPGQRELNRDLMDIARAFDLKVVCTNDSHYVEQDHSVPHDLLLCIQTGKKASDEKRLKFDNSNFYLKSREEMARLFAQVPQALMVPWEIAQTCDVKIEFGKNRYPVFRLPVELAASGKTNPEYLRELCLRGVKRRYGVDYQQPEAAADPARAREICQRLDYELEIISKTGFVDYFLIVHDFINWAKSRSIPVGPGRGSGAGCLVAYVLEITDTDPMFFRLLFERMLNLERVSPPDFDIDFCMRRRDEVIEYVRNRYGADCVANIITFGTFGAKMVIRDIARVLDIPYSEADRMAKMVPENQDMTIEKAIAGSAELAAEIQHNPVAQKIFDLGRVIEGMVRNTGRHAAGIIICDKPLIEMLPVTLQEGALTTQYEKGTVEELGLLKMDFLGLKNLTVINDAENYIRQTVQSDFDLNKVPFDDPRTYQILREARTVGVFQMESSGMQSLCRQLEVQNIEEIVALIALYRPGPMEWIPDYIKGKKDPSSIQYPHPLLRDLLRETYGVMVYQEQVMESAKILAGYTLGGADILRRAMGKKKVEEMEKQRGIFVKGCQEHNHIEEKTALELFSILEKFAGYGFNKSHSAAYAILSYRTAFLKANYPLQFMAAALTCELGNSENLAKFLDECQAMGISVEGPDINHSREGFYPLIRHPGAYRKTGRPSEEGSILFGLSGIKGVGELAAQKIIEERQRGGLFQSFRDFLVRVDNKTVNRRVLENLIKAGAFDCLQEDRGSLLHDLDQLLAEVETEQRDRAAGQARLFDFFRENAAAGEGAANSRKVKQRFPLPLNEQLLYEKELCGFFVTGHPLNPYRHLADAVDTITGDNFRQLPDRTPFRLCGVVTKVDKKISKKDNRPWAILTVSTRDSIYNINFYSDAFEKNQSRLVAGALLCVGGAVSLRNNEVQLIGDTAGALEASLAHIIKKIRWMLHPGSLADDFLHKLREILDRQCGDIEMEVGFVLDDAWCVLATLASPMRWKLVPETFQELRRHAAVAGLQIECTPPAPREQPWKKAKPTGV